MVRVPLRKPTVATLTCSACRENIYGNFAVGLFGLTENHGSGYNQSLGPTNATGTPQIKNMLIKDVVLTETMGPAVVFSLAEAPIKNFTLQNSEYGKGLLPRCRLTQTAAAVSLLVDAQRSARWVPVHGLEGHEASDGPLRDGPGHRRDATTAHSGVRIPRPTCRRSSRGGANGHAAALLPQRRRIAVRL